MCTLLHNNRVGISGNQVYFLTCFVQILALISVNPIMKTTWFPALSNTFSTILLTNLHYIFCGSYLSTEKKKKEGSAYLLWSNHLWGSRAPDQRGTEDNSKIFFLISQWKHMLWLLMGHNIWFYGDIWLIIPKLSLLPLLIWSTGPTTYELLAVQKL